MIIARPAAERGHAVHPGLDSWHTFSFGQYHDPKWMGFGPLRVINEDRLAAGAGFPPHRHANMEIISVVLSGALAHRDSTGGEGVLHPGEVQWMSAGHGVEHSEYNGDDAATTHFLQIWLQPDRVNAEPAYAQQAFDLPAQAGQWVTLASPDGADGSIAIRQQAWLRGCALPQGQKVDVSLDASRLYWLHVATGEISVDGHALVAGDALGFIEEARTLTLEGVSASAELLLFDLPR